MVIPGDFNTIFFTVLTPISDSAVIHAPEKPPMHEILIHFLDSGFILSSQLIHCPASSSLKTLKFVSLFCYLLT